MPYAARAVPWLRIAVHGVLVVALMEVVQRWPWQTWPLQGCAVALLAAGAASCFDEPAAVLVDALPRPLWWRTTARAAGVLLLLGAWSVAVLRSWDDLFAHPWHVAWQGVAACLAGAAWAAWRRSGGDPDPGVRLGLVVVPLVTAWALVRPFSQQLPVFPYADGSGDFGDWGASLAGWVALGGVAVVALVAALGDARWWWPRTTGRTSGRGVALTMGRHRVRSVD
jgi:hypothetical protein